MSSIFENLLVLFFEVIVMSIFVDSQVLQGYGKVIMPRTLGKTSTGVRVLFVTQNLVILDKAYGDFFRKKVWRQFCSGGDC